MSKIKSKVAYYDELAKGCVTLFGDEKDRTLQLDNICNAYIGATNHLAALQQYPILQLAYNMDGSKKDITTLLRDREAILENGGNEKSTNELYSFIANKKNFYTQGLTGIKPEMIALEQYIKETGTEDEFVYDLLKDRLEMKNLTPESIEKILHNEREFAKCRREQLEAEKAQKEKVKWKNRFNKWNNELDEVIPEEQIELVKRRIDIENEISGKIENNQIKSTANKEEER